MLVSAGESPVYVAETMGHRDYRLVSAVYARWIAPGTLLPGAPSATHYTAEWTQLKDHLMEENSRPASLADDLATDDIEDDKDMEYTDDE